MRTQAEAQTRDVRTELRIAELTGHVLRGGSLTGQALAHAVASPTD